MATIMGYEKIAKKDLYKRILDLAISVGWANISSKPDVDWDVLYSKGENNDKELYINLQPTNGGSDFSKTSYYLISHRFINKYTPGAAGVAGTFDRPNAWGALYIFSTSVNPTDTVGFNYNINKDRIIFATELPMNLASTGYTGNITFIGSPILFEPEINNRSMSVAQGVSVFGSAVMMNNSPHTDTDNSAAYPTYGMIPPAEFTPEEKRFMSEICIGNTLYGFRGKLDGIYALANSYFKTNNGDTLVDEKGQKYKVFKLYAFSSGSYLHASTSMYAFRIE